MAGKKQKLDMALVNNKAGNIASTVNNVKSTIDSKTSYLTGGTENGDTTTVTKFKLSQNLRNRLESLKTNVSFMDGNSEYMGDPAVKEKFNAEMEKVKGAILQKTGSDPIKQTIVNNVLNFKDMDDAKRIFVLCGLDMKEYVDGLAEGNGGNLSNEITSRISARVDDIYALSGEICKELAGSTGQFIKDIAANTKNRLVSYITKGTTSLIAQRSSYWTKELTKSVADIQKELKEDNRTAEEASKAEMEKTKENTTNFINDISDKMSYNIEKISAFAKGVGSSLGNVFEDVGETASDWAYSVGQFGSNVGNTVGGWFSGSGENSSKSANAASKIFDALPGIKDFAYSYVIGPFCSICTNGPDTVEDFVNGKCNDLEDTMNKKVEGLTYMVEGKVFDAVDSVAQTVGDAAANFINTKAKKVIIAANQKKTLLLNQSIGKAKTAIMTAVGQILGKLGPAGKPVAKGMKMALDSIKFPGLS